MKKTAKAALLLFGAYAILVASSGYVIRYSPKIARFFVPPFFQFSESVFSGRASPFIIGMKSVDVPEMATQSNLTREICHPAVRIEGSENPATYCYKFGLTGVHWDIWTARDRVFGIRIWTTMNLTSE